MFQQRGIFSEGYTKYLERKDNIRAVVKKAMEELRGGKLYGEPITLENPEEVIAALYLLYKDFEMFHEPI